MDDADLDKELKKLREPDWSDGYWEAFPKRMLARLEAPRARSRGSSRPFRLFPVAWAGTIAAAAVAAVFFLGRAHRARPGADAYAWLSNDSALRQVLSFFPHQVRAIVEDKGGVHLVLSDSPDVPASPAYWIDIRNGAQRQVAVTFSGQELQIGGDRVEVLANPKGQVTLIGDRLLWSSTGLSSTPSSLHIQVRELGQIL